MKTPKIFTGNTKAEVWQKIAEDFARQGDILTYTALLKLRGHETLMDIDIDLGGGFESGFSTTLFRTRVPQPTAFSFSIFKQDLLNEVGKLLGMEDVKLGYPEFDAAYIVQTNQPEKAKELFADETIRHTMLRHSDAKLKLSADDNSSDAYLEFTKDDAIVETAALREVYRMLLTILDKISTEKL